MTELTRPGEKGAGVGLGVWEKDTFPEEEKSQVKAKGLEKPQSAERDERKKFSATEGWYVGLWGP